MNSAFLSQFSLHRRRYIESIQRQLSDAKSGYIVLAGDSHAAYLPPPHFPRPTINAGIPGATARSCARDLSALRPRVPGRLAILILGTNDITSASALSAAAISAFSRSATQVVRRLKSFALDVMVSAIPPAPDTGVMYRDPRAVEAYSDALAVMSGDNDADFFDPFLSMRGRTFGAAVEGVFIDGTHLLDYHALEFRIGNSIRSRLCLTNHVSAALPCFDPKYYADWYPDTHTYPRGLEQHYLDIGWIEGRDPCGPFSNDGYLGANPDVLASGVNPLVHFLEAGFAQGRIGWQKASALPTNHKPPR